MKQTVYLTNEIGIISVCIKINHIHNLNPLIYIYVAQSVDKKSNWY